MTDLARNLSRIVLSSALVLTLTGHSRAQSGSCTRDEIVIPDIAAELNSLFGGFSPVSNFTLSRAENTCVYYFEQKARPQDFYRACLNWKIHKKLEGVGIGMIAGIEANDGRYANLGGNKFGLREVLSVQRVNSARTRLKGSHGLVVYLLGVPLRLPRQGFEVSLDSTPQGYQSANWRWNDFYLNVVLRVPTPPLGDMSIGFTTEFSSWRVISNRYLMYTHGMLEDCFTMPVWMNDWAWYTHSAYFEKFDCENYWGLQITSPPLGISLGFISAELRLILAAQIGGMWQHADPCWYGPAGAGFTGRIFNYNRLEASAEAKARIRATLSVFGFRVSKEWTIVDIGTESGRNLDGSKGRRVAEFSVDYHKPPVERFPCPPGTPPPPPEDWIADVTGRPAIDRPDDGPTDLQVFSRDLMRAVRERYFLCDENMNPFQPERDSTFVRLTQDIRLKRFRPDEACKRLRAYFDAHLYLCERTECGTICRLDGVVTDCAQDPKQPN